MKKFFSIMCVMALVFAAGQVSAQQFLINGNNPEAFSLTAIPPECGTITIAVDPGVAINTPLITAGFWLAFDDSQVSVNSSAAYDGALTPALWDPGFTGVVDQPAGAGTWFITVGNFATVPVNQGPVLIADVELCCTGQIGESTIDVITIPGFDTVVGDTTVWDGQIAAGLINLSQTPPPPCECTSLEPASAVFDSNSDVQQFTPQVIGTCNPNNFEYTTDCTQIQIDASGLATVVPAGITADEDCTVTATDLANTGVVCSSVIDINFISCTGEIARGRECPGEEIDDPAYNRPGRRGLVATCGDIIDFTVCENCVEEVCLEWTVEPAESWLTINQIDDCCWRLTIGDNCDELTKTKEYEVTVTDTCNGWSDSVILEIGKVVIDLGDTAVDPQSGTAAVAVDLINPDHHIRALAFDVEANNLECTACTADPDRALQFTCSAADQGDGTCRVVMYSTNPAALIQSGAGQVATILYDAIDPAAGNCEVLHAINEQASDQFNEDLCTCGAPGEVCFKTCGDIYPQDCIGGECADEVCGDGVVDLFDILEAIDIILGLQDATLCQIGNADVPNGMPPYCGNPPGDPNCETDGDIDIFDVLVMIDKALGKTNCCDYCNFGSIF